MFLGKSLMLCVINPSSACTEWNLRVQFLLSLLSPPALVILVEDALALLHLQVQVVKDAGQVHQAVVCKCAHHYISCGPESTQGCMNEWADGGGRQRLN